jgi:predicted regulator of Ras-like GTPase activity (Roadblock/LC7/MglB family)
MRAAIGEELPHEIAPSDAHASQYASSPMDAQQALADLTEISSQIQAAVVFDDSGSIAASTSPDEERARALADGAARLLAEGEGLASSAPLTQLEAATSDGSVFLVADGKTRIAATTAAEPTVGLVFYDLKSALRSIAEKPAPKKRGPAATKPPAPKKPPAATKPPAPKKPPAAKKPAPKKKPDAS